jgi:S1-C subfamily serine protease
LVLPRPLFKELFDALKGGFPSYVDLELMVRLGLNERLADIAAPGPVPPVVLALITWAEARGRIVELVIAAAAANPGEPALAAVGKRMAMPLSVAGELERIVQKNVGFQNVLDWLARMDTVRRAVCRIEDKDGVPVGTGFLVGPNLALTNEHVVQGLRERGVEVDDRGDPGAARVRFDYVVPMGAKTPDLGHTVRLATSCLVAEDGPLDFALLKLDGRPGDQPVGDTPRGWLTPPPTPPLAQGDPVIILQHPGGDPVKLTIGTVRDPKAAGSRITYTANTQPGSSGSPCFDSQLELCAIHYQGRVQENAGILLSAVREHLASGGRPNLFEA